jgi:hypothetical protein
MMEPLAFFNNGKAKRLDKKNWHYELSALLYRDDHFFSVFFLSTLFPFPENISWHTSNFTQRNIVAYRDGEPVPAN